MLCTHMVSYAGKTIEATVTDNAYVADNWVKHTESKYKNYHQNIIVGLNCKWSPHPLRSLTNSTATLQLCVDTNCLILQLLHINCGIPKGIINFLSNPKFKFVGVEAEEVGVKLRSEFGLDLGKKVLDIRKLAKIHFPLSFHGNVGLKALAGGLVELPVCKPKSVPWKNLESRVLDNEVVRIACIDAYVCFRIGDKLLKQIM